MYTLVLNSWASFPNPRRNTLVFCYWWWVMINKDTFTSINIKLRCTKKIGDSEHWQWSWCPQFFVFVSGWWSSCWLPTFIPYLLTCSPEVLWASINLFRFSPRLEMFLSIICNLIRVKLLFSWGVYGARDTDVVRQSLILVTDVLEILAKGGIEGDTKVKFSRVVSDITLTY